MVKIQNTWSYTSTSHKPSWHGAWLGKGTLTQITVLTTKYCELNLSINTVVLQKHFFWGGGVKMMFQPSRIKITPLKAATPSAPNTVALHPYSSEKELYLILLPAGEVGDIFPRFLYGGRSERETDRSAPWRQELPCVFSHTDAKNRPRKGCEGKQEWFAWSMKVYRRRVVNALLISFLPSQSWFFMWKFLPEVTSPCFKDQQFHKQLANNSALTAIQRVEHSLRNQLYRAINRL